MPDVAPLMPDTLQWLPASGRPEQLMLLLHGWGASAADMAPLALALQAAFPQAALLAPQGFVPGTGMFFNGIKSPEERRDLISYLLIESRRN